jgi:hypothetical protein
MSPEVEQTKARRAQSLYCALPATSRPAPSTDACLRNGAIKRLRPTALQEPWEDERPVVVSIDTQPHAIADTVIARLGLETVGNDRGGDMTRSAAAAGAGRESS